MLWGMDTLTANSVGKTRYITRDGKPFLVVPASLIVPGVLNGSKGALYYSKDEVFKNPSIWNGTPITIGHPVINGVFVSARTHGVKTYGELRLAKEHNGKLVAQAVIDAKALQQDNPRLYDQVANGLPTELSTGLYPKIEPAPQGSSYLGTRYDYVTSNYNPDHLAILPDQRGACAVDQGCGLNVNASAEQLNEVNNSAGCGCEKCQLDQVQNWDESKVNRDAIGRFAVTDRIKFPNGKIGEIKTITERGWEEFDLLQKAGYHPNSPSTQKLADKLSKAVADDNAQRKYLADLSVTDRIKRDLHTPYDEFKNKNYLQGVKRLGNLSLPGFKSSDHVPGTIPSDLTTDEKEITRLADRAIAQQRVEAEKRELFERGYHELGLKRTESDNYRFDNRLDKIDYKDDKWLRNRFEIENRLQPGRWNSPEELRRSLLPDDNPESLSYDPEKAAKLKRDIAEYEEYLKANIKETPHQRFKRSIEPAVSKVIDVSERAKDIVLGNLPTPLALKVLSAATMVVPQVLDLDPRVKIGGGLGAAIGGMSTGTLPGAALGNIVGMGLGYLFAKYRDRNKSKVVTNQKVLSDKEVKALAIKLIKKLIDLAALEQVVNREYVRDNAGRFAETAGSGNNTSSETKSAPGKISQAISKYKTNYADEEDKARARKSNETGAGDLYSHLIRPALKTSGFRTAAAMATVAGGSAAILGSGLAVPVGIGVVAGATSLAALPSVLGIINPKYRTGEDQRSIDEAHQVMKVLGKVTAIGGGGIVGLATGGPLGMAAGLVGGAVAPKAVPYIAKAALSTGSKAMRAMWEMATDSYKGIKKGIKKGLEPTGNSIELTKEQQAKEICAMLKDPAEMKKFIKAIHCMQLEAKKHKVEDAPVGNAEGDIREYTREGIHYKQIEGPRGHWGKAVRVDGGTEAPKKVSTGRKPKTAKAAERIATKAAEEAEEAVIKAKILEKLAERKRQKEEDEAIGIETDSKRAKYKKIGKWALIGGGATLGALAAAYPAATAGTIGAIASGISYAAPHVVDSAVGIGSTIGEAAKVTWPLVKGGAKFLYATAGSALSSGAPSEAALSPTAIKLLAGGAIGGVAAGSLGTKVGTELLGKTIGLTGRVLGRGAKVVGRGAKNITEKVLDKAQAELDWKSGTAPDTSSKKPPKPSPPGSGSGGATSTATPVDSTKKKSKKSKDQAQIEKMERDAKVAEEEQKKAKERTTKASTEAAKDKFINGVAPTVDTSKLSTLAGGVAQATEEVAKKKEEEKSKLSTRAIDQARQEREREEANKIKEEQAKREARLRPSIDKFNNIGAARALTAGKAKIIYREKPYREAVEAYERALELSEELKDYKEVNYYKSEITKLKAKANKDGVVLNYSRRFMNIPVDVQPTIVYNCLATGKPGPCADPSKQRDPKSLFRRMGEGLKETIHYNRSRVKGLAIGTGIGAVAGGIGGSAVPGLGTGLGAVAGASIGGQLGQTVGIIKDAVRRGKGLGFIGGAKKDIHARAGEISLGIGGRVIGRVAGGLAAGHPGAEVGDALGSFGGDVGLAVDRYRRYRREKLANNFDLNEYILNCLATGKPGPCKTGAGDEEDKSPKGMMGRMRGLATKALAAAGGMAKKAMDAIPSKAGRKHSEARAKRKAALANS